MTDKKNWYLPDTFNLKCIDLIKLIEVFRGNDYSFELHTLSGTETQNDKVGIKCTECDCEIIIHNTFGIVEVHRRDKESWKFKDGKWEMIK